MHTNYISVDGHGDLVRDPNSKAILNINRSEIELAREKKRLRKIKQQEEQNLKEAVTVLQNEISDIKLLLSQLVEKL